MYPDHTRAIVSLVVGRNVCTSPFFVADVYSRLVACLPDASVKLLEVGTTPLFHFGIRVDRVVVRVHADRSGIFSAWAEGASGMVQFDGVKVCRVPTDVFSDARVQERLSALASDWSGEWPRDPLPSAWEAAKAACDEAEEKEPSRSPYVKYLDERCFVDAVQTVVALV
jgi:hypothetical protein